MSRLYSRQQQPEKSFEEATQADREAFEKILGAPAQMRPYGGHEYGKAGQYVKIAREWAQELKAQGAAPESVWLFARFDPTRSSEAWPTSLLELAHQHDKALAQTLDHFLEAGGVNARGQVRLESLLHSKMASRRYTAFSKQTPEQMWRDFEEKNPEATAWGRLLAQTEYSTLGATGCKAILSTLTPLLVSQNSQEDVEKIARDAIQWALDNAPAQAPKASLRTALTNPQKMLEKMAKRCAAFAGEVESLLAARGASVKETLVSEPLKAVLAAFEAKAKADKAAAQKTENAAGAQTDDAQKTASHGALGLPAGLHEWQNSAIVGSRQSAMLEAAARGDLMVFSLMMKEANLPGSAWNDPGRSPSSSVVDRICEFAVQATRNSKIGAESLSVSFQLAAQMLSMMAQTGLDFTVEARNSSNRESNPFLRARKALPPIEPGAGILTQTWMESLAGQLRASGVEIEDAVALLEEALATDIHANYTVPPKDQTFTRVARAFVEGWQLREELKKSGFGGAAQAGAPSAESQEISSFSAPAPAVAKRKARSL